MWTRHAGRSQLLPIGPIYSLHTNVLHVRKCPLELEPWYQNTSSTARNEASLPTNYIFPSHHILSPKSFHFTKSHQQNSKILPSHHPHYFTLLTIYLPIPLTMLLRALTIFLALSSVVTGLQSDGNTIVSRSVPHCATLGTNPTNKLCYGSYQNGSTWQELPTISHSNIGQRSVPPCSELGANTENKLCWMPGSLLNGPERHLLSARDQTELPEWSEPIHEVWDGGNATTFCIRDGPTPKAEDIKKLCSRINDNQIIARTKQKHEKDKEGNCFCKKFHEGTAWFKVCNCDRCDRLEILDGLKKMCKETTDQCASKGYSSGFMKLEEKNGLLMQYNVLPPNVKSGKLEPDPMQAKPEFTSSTCRSNNEQKLNQDYTGPVEECWRSWKTLWIARKCHDHSMDTAESRSSDYWHNKTLKWLSDAFHSRSSS